MRAAILQHEHLRRDFAAPAEDFLAGPGKMILLPRYISPPQIQSDFRLQRASRRADMRLFRPAISTPPTGSAIGRLDERGKASRHGRARDCHDGDAISMCVAPMMYIDKMLPTPCFSAVSGRFRADDDAALSRGNLGLTLGKIFNKEDGGALLLACSRRRRGCL